MGRKVFLFLMLGWVLGALAGWVAQGMAGEPEQGVAGEQVSVETGSDVVSGVADYWAEDSRSFEVVGGYADYFPEGTPPSLAQGRGPMETGALPGKAEGMGNESPTEEAGD
jgi:hypothetical protein